MEPGQIFSYNPQLSNDCYWKEGVDYWITQKQETTPIIEDCRATNSSVRGTPSYKLQSATDELCKKLIELSLVQMTPCQEEQWLAVISGLKDQLAPYEEVFATKPV